MTGVEPGDCDQEALFELEGPDEDGCVWILSGVGMDAQTFNLGPRAAVAERFIEWLGRQGYGERPGDSLSELGPGIGQAGASGGRATLATP